MAQVVENLWNERTTEATSTDTAVTGDIFVTAEPEARSKVMHITLLTMLCSNPRLLRGL